MIVFQDALAVWQVYSRAIYVSPSQVLSIRSCRNRYRARLSTDDGAHQRSKPTLKTGCSVKVEIICLTDTRRLVGGNAYLAIKRRHISGEIGVDLPAAEVTA